MIDLMLTVSSTNKLLEAIVKAVELNVANLDESVESLAKSNDALLAEVRQTTRKKDKGIFTSTETEDPYADLRHNVDGNFIQVIFDIYSTLQTGYSALSRIAKGLIPGEVLVVGERLTAHPKTIEELSAFSVQYNMNRAAINDFASGTVLAERADHVVVEIGNKIVNILDRYYHTLLQRHEFDGVQVHGNPILTDIAMSVYANVDANGEVKDGKNPDEVSAYSLRKAMLVIEAVKFGPIGQIIDNPDTLMSIIRTGLKDLRDLGVKLADFAAPTAQRIRRLHPNTYREPKRIKDHVFEASLGYLSDLDPRNVVFRDKQQMATAEEQLEATFKNETLAQIVSRLKDPDCSPTDLVGYVLTRKAELHKYYQEVNSFYVCKIGTGNQFSGEAPGGLTVVPGVKPVVNIDDVVGSGFDQVKEFILQIREGAKWHDLFLATSPSKSGDKANALLIGPQGCGKSEVLRGIGGDKQAIGIYAQPSDFLTCWKGEAEKNPKRLFEAALKLQKDSGKQVFILIDEVDTILNDDHARGGFGSTNLTTEFQQLMDGILRYPNIAVWSATNHPERIPMPMIRRFSKVAVVGELNQADRVKLLKHFTGFVPISHEFPEAAWEDAATLLEGAVGDTLRKVADHIWREKMSDLVRNHPRVAEKIIAKLTQDGAKKFQVSQLTKEMRADIHKDMRPFVEVTAEDLIASTAIHLDNIAIRTEIATAVETYERSKLFLAGIKSHATRAS